MRRKLPQPCSIPTTASISVCSVMPIGRWHWARNNDWLHHDFLMVSPRFQGVALLAPQILPKPPRNWNGR